TCGERLELLAVVRGLEALDGPARVTLVTKSRYVSRGLRFGMTEWRANDWQWERFGRVVPVKDHDLWQRIDRALLFHQVECQAWQFEEGVAEQSPSCEAARSAEVTVDCSDNAARACEPAPVSAVAESGLAPIRHRRVPRSRVRKRRLGPQNAGLQRGLANALVTKAASLRDTLQS